MNTEQTTEEVVQLNLVNEITNMLASMKHESPNAWTKYLHPDAFITSDIGIQRFLINRCFHMILGSVTTENTMDTRYCLVDTGDINRWLELFKDGIAPTVVRLSLPLAVN